MDVQGWIEAVAAALMAGTATFTGWLTWCEVRQRRSRGRPRRQRPAGTRARTHPQRVACVPRRRTKRRIRAPPRRASRGRTALAGRNLVCVLDRRLSGNE
jgi:hypothetical protein